jgi:hypothetical protein
MPMPSGRHSHLHDPIGLQRRSPWEAYTHVNVTIVPRESMRYARGLIGGEIPYGQKTRLRLDGRGYDPAIAHPVACMLLTPSYILNAK